MDRRTATKLLCYCLIAEPDTAKAAELARLEPRDWSNIHLMSQRHAVAPLLYQRLRTARLLDILPSDVARELQRLYLRNAQRNLLLSHHAGRLLAVLHERGIPVIPLKGIYLAHVIYGNPSARSMGDVDLLVQRDDLPAAETALLAMGCTPSRQNDRYLKEHFHLVYMSESARARVAVEIHWDLAMPDAPYRPDIAGLWQRARPSHLNGVPMAVLSPEDLLLHLCVHAAGHLFDMAPIRSLCDISQALRHHRRQIDWDRVCLSAHQWHGALYVALALRLTEEWLDAEIPEGVFQGLTPPDSNGQLLARVAERILAPAADNPDEMFNNLGLLQASERLSDKVAIMLRACFPSPHRMADLYGLSPRSPRCYLYYPVRIKDLVVRHARRLWLLVRGDRETAAWLEREAARVALQRKQ